MRRPPPKRPKAGGRPTFVVPDAPRWLSPRAIAPGIALIAVMFSLFGAMPPPRMVPSPPTPSPFAQPDPPGAQALTTVEPTPTNPPTPLSDPVVVTREANDSVPASIACVPECLLRLEGGAETVALLAEIRLVPSYADADVVWMAAAKPVVDAIRLANISFELIATEIETLPLYVARTPIGGDPTPVYELGEVIDSFGRALIVSVPGPPPYMLGLVDVGIALEKLAPGQALPASGLPALGDPWIPATEVSAFEIEATIAEMQELGADEGLGTRHYATAGNVEAAEYLFKRLAAYGLKVRYEDFIADNGRLTLNVVGEIAGRDQSEIMLLTAHFDSIADDTGDPALAPGALDNSSGVAALIETARVLSAFDLPHPVHIVFFNAEEVGLQGSLAFANRAVAENRPYVAALNVDSVGAILTTNKLIVNATAQSLFIQTALVEIATVNSGLGIEVLPRQNPIIVADETRLNDAGIPAVLLASVMYGDPLINQSNDTLASVDPFRVLRITQLIVLTLAAL